MKKFWDPTFYNTYHGYVARYGKEVVTLLAPKKGERILDLGCGTGTLTQEIAQAGAEVVGIDNSEEMIKKALESYPNLDFKIMDGHNFSFEHPFDAVFSNAALHWMLEPKKVIACVWRCLKDQGRFVFEMGGKGNLRHILSIIDQAGVQVAPLLNYYPSLGEYASLLEAQGFRVTYATLFDRPTPLEGREGLRHWIQMFRKDVSEASYERIEEIARPQLYHEGCWWVDYVRLRVVAIKT